MRLFIAIPIPPAVTEELAAVRRSLERDGDALRWSSPDAWHITLQFLGNTTVDRCDCLVEALQNLHTATVPIQIKGLGHFDRVGAFFADIQVTQDLIRLQHQVTLATRPCGFEPEDRPYHPHITLARKRGRSDGVRTWMPRLANPQQFSVFIATEFLLYESFLSPSGSRYEVRNRFPLGGS